MPIWIKSICFLIPAMILNSGLVFPACETACSDIADDEAAFARIEENIQAIEAETAYILEWQADPVTNTNPIALSVGRRIQNADKIREVLTDYFLYQRIMPTAENRGSDVEKYRQRLALIHSLLNALIQTKDSYDPNVTVNLRSKLDEFKNFYYQQASFRLGQVS